jgi:hypothetical protein
MFFQFFVRNKTRLAAGIMSLTDATAERVLAMAFSSVKRF